MLENAALRPLWQILTCYRDMLLDALRFRVNPAEYRKLEPELRRADRFVRKSILELAYYNEHWHEIRGDLEGTLYYDQAGALRFLHYVIDVAMADALARQDAMVAKVVVYFASEAWSDAELPSPPIEWCTIMETVDALPITPVFIWAGEETPPVAVRQVLIAAEEALRDIVKRDPDAIFRVSPREFEQLIAFIFREQGFVVQLTQATRDGGRDIIAIHDVLGLRAKYLIECKRYAPHKTVGLALVQRLFGVKVSEGATKAVLVTTSTFTRDARQFASRHVWELDLRAYDDVMNWINAGIAG